MEYKRIMNDLSDVFIDEREYKVIKIILQGIKDVYKLIGNNDKYEIDRMMTIKFDDLEMIYDGYEVLSIEGERDGVLVAEIQKNNSMSNRKIVLDPIDGTLTCSKDGSRAISVIAIANDVNKNLLKVPDGICCLSFGSNINPIYDSLFSLNDLSVQKIKEIIKSSGMLSTLNRRETESLVNIFIGEENKEIGETTCYMPCELSKTLFKAGDTSVPLFLETDSYIGRSGGTEALIESRLWKYWSGLLVSGKKMKNHPQGVIGYLKDRIKYSKEYCDFGIDILFEDNEITELKKLGWTNEKILKPLSASEFSPEYDFIAIASLTGTKDSILSKHSKMNLEPISLDDENNKMSVNFWIKSNNYTGMVDVIYNIETSNILCIKKNKML